MISPCATKADMIRAALLQDPDQSLDALARKVGAWRSQVFKIHKAMAREHGWPKRQTLAARIRAALNEDPFQNVPALARRLGCREYAVYFQRKRMGISGRQSSFVPVPSDPGLAEWLADEARKMGEGVTPGMAARAILTDVMHGEAG